MYKCEFCEKEFNNYQGLAGHKSHCKANPNFDNEKYKKRQNKSLNQANKKLAEIRKNNRHNYKFICQKCGKEYELNLTERAFNKGNYTKFCCRSCANSRIRTPEIKEKIKNALNVFNNNKDNSVKNIIKDINQYNKENMNFDEFKAKHPNIVKTCKICGKEFIPTIRPNGNKISSANVCSKKCHKQLMIENGHKAHEIAIKNGRFKPWQSRKIISYPEHFWINVLNNNNIQFIHNHYFENKYFLDFYIKVNNIEIDLEIDGKQHRYKDRKQHDKERDEFIKNHNLIVYRIEWNEINSEKGSLLMKEKINNFIKFYNNIQQCQ